MGTIRTFAERESALDLKCGWCEKPTLFHTRSTKRWHGFLCRITDSPLSFNTGPIVKPTPPGTDRAAEIFGIISECDFPEYGLRLLTVNGSHYIQASYYEQDTVTGAREMQHTRHWLVSPEAGRSEIVATCFKCVLTSMEHKAREWFTYRDKPIFNPHQDVDKLLEITEARP